MRFIVLTLFKEMFVPFVETSIIKRAIEKNICSIETIDIRDFTEDKHNRVDFPPYGGGSGMVISAQPLSKAIDYALEKLKSDNKEIKILYMSPRGRVLNYKISKELSSSNYNYIIICGHYEGIDERIIEEYNVEELSIGDYVLTGGEVPSMVITDAITRLIPGVITSESLDSESFNDGMLDYPNYTRPEVFRGMRVPEVLLSGHHKNIEKYRQEEKVRLTMENRSDLTGGDNIG